MVEHPRTNFDDLSNFLEEQSSDEAALSISVDGGLESSGSDFEELVKLIPEFMGEEYRIDPEFRFAVLANQIGDIARHISHDPERNPPTRPLDEPPEVAFGDALWQLLCVAYSMNINIDESIEHAIARMDSREGYMQQSDIEMEGLVAHGNGVISGSAGVNILVVDEFSEDLSVDIGKFRAIVTEIGGISSHAATISREKDIPCIVGVKSVTENLSFGDTVIVDFDNGKVKGTH